MCVLQGCTLFLYEYDGRSGIDHNSVHKHALWVENSIVQAVPEHPKKDFVFCLSNSVGDAFLFQVREALEFKTSATLKAELAWQYFMQVKVKSGWHSCIQVQCFYILSLLFGATVHTSIKHKEKQETGSYFPLGDLHVAHQYMFIMCWR